jgi:heavy metal sensor kinase
MSLRVRLTFIYSVLIAIVLVAVAVAVYLLTERSLMQSLEDRGRQALSDLSKGLVSESLLRLPGDAYYEIVAYLQSDERVLPSQDLIQGVYYTSLARDVRQNPTRDNIPSLLSQESIDTLRRDGWVNTRVQLANGRRLLVFATLSTVQDRIFRGSTQTASIDVTRTFPALLLVGIPLNSVTDILTRLSRALTLVVMVAFVSFAIGVWLLSYRVLAPVKRVTQTASRVTGLDLSQRVPVPKTDDEIKELAVTLNHMLDRLQESFETQRRFTADASHELRTPVTAIVGHANYLLRRTKPSGEQVDSLTVIRREAERMAKLVNDLLELARADAGFSIKREPMNLVEVVEAVHMETTPVAGQTVIEVSSHQPLVEVLGDAARLKQVVLNLVQNAINAGAQRIVMTVSQEKGQVRLEILDDGPGIPQEAIPHLFDRFYRVDGARSTRGNGSGLGLAIVKWIVQQHEGTVSVESRLGEGTVFTVLIPTPNVKQTEANVLKQTFSGLGVPSRASSQGV